MKTTSNTKTKRRRSTGELGLFRQIAATEPPFSFLSGLPVDPMDISCYAHVLCKKLYPNFRLEKRNVVYLTPREHYLYDQGTDDERMDYEKKNNVKFSKLFKLKETLANEYKETFKVVIFSKNSLPVLSAMGGSQEHRDLNTHLPATQ